MVCPAAQKRVPRVCCGAADRIGVTRLFASPLPGLAVPGQRRGLLVPSAGRLLKPSPDLGRALRVLTIEGAALQDTLDRLGHVQPTAAERCVERHDAVPAQPEHHLGCLMPGEIVPYQQDAQRRKLRGQGEALGQTGLPDLPGRAVRHRLGRRRLRRQRRDDRVQALLQPAVQHRIGAAGHRSEVHLPGGGLKQHQDLARARPHVFVRLQGGPPLRSPTAARIRHGLEWAGLVLAPDRQTHGPAERIGLLDQPLFTAASRATTVTVPCLTVPCLTVPCLTVPCLTVPCLTVPCLTVPCLTVPCLTVPCLTVPCLTV